MVDIMSYLNTAQKDPILSLVPVHLVPQLPQGPIDPVLQQVQAIAHIIQLSLIIRLEEVLNHIAKVTVNPSSPPVQQRPRTTVNQKEDNSHAPEAPLQSVPHGV